MAGLQAWIAIVGGILGVLGVVVAVTRYITNVQARLDQEKVAAENRGLQGRIGELETQRNLLLDQIAVGSRAGSAALHRKAQIDELLKTLMQKVGATGGSIYVPVRSPRGKVQGLAFLSIEPFRAETQVLKTKVIPMKSLAGRCFDTGQSFVTLSAQKDPDHFEAASKIAAYRPSTALNLTVRHEGETTGVLQLLRKEGEAGFTETDLTQAQAMLGDLPAQLSEITRTPDYLKVLGLGGEAEAEQGTVLIFDLTRSSVLFEELSAAFALQFLNEYLERMCEIAFKAGATLENYMGDGALLGFNVPQRLAEHEIAAVRAALEMNHAFQELRTSWATISPRLAAVQHRCGVSSGPLHRATVGHPRDQRLTLIGYPISVAAALCDVARRDVDVAVISAETFAVVGERLIVEPLATDALGKAAAFTQGAYEVVGLR